MPKRQKTTVEVSSHVGQLQTTNFMPDDYVRGDQLAFEACWPNKGKLRKGDIHVDDIVGQFRSFVREPRTEEQVMLYLPVFMPSETEGCYFYVLKCADGTLYAGISNNPVHRLREHLSGRGAKYMRPKSRWPASIVYRERLASRSHAAQRECWFKKLVKAKKLEVIKAA